ncbi:hypothetical protein [Candidatus Borrarchaeum sp.]|uniref:hypothetical protein n=1 Tax=Candidatus Borrarchaeum sp. TaxID=2846742 RepID=UPI0025804041|nr:hypothetical protein [Candidatus Borrarchaeum sp.]
MRERVVSVRLDKIIKNGKFSEIDNPPESLQLYNVWLSYVNRPFQAIRETNNKWTTVQKL